MRYTSQDSNTFRRCAMKIVERSSAIFVFLTPLALLPAWAANDSAPGVPNFHKVNEQVYRGGQPKDQGWASLAHLGVKTVVDLRRPGEHSTSHEAEEVEAAGMRYFNVPMHGVVAPSEEQVDRVLAFLNSSTEAPVFVHCKRGADRTGTVIACYRIEHDGWDNQRALKEAKSYGMSWLQIGMKHYVMDFHAPTVQAAGTPGLAPALP
jgi:tyrosine-protein phosphatase SIW14